MYLHYIFDVKKYMKWTKKNYDFSTQPVEHVFVHKWSTYMKIDWQKINHDVEKKSELNAWLTKKYKKKDKYRFKIVSMLHLAARKYAFT